MAVKFSKRWPSLSRTTSFDLAKSLDAVDAVLLGSFLPVAAAASVSPLVSLRPASDLPRDPCFPWGASPVCPSNIPSPNPQLSTKTLRQHHNHRRKLEFCDESVPCLANQTPEKQEGVFCSRKILKRCIGEDPMTKVSKYIPAQLELPRST
jgi:hypothetical protein